LFWGKRHQAVRQTPGWASSAGDMAGHVTRLTHPFRYRVGESEPKELPMLFQRRNKGLINKKKHPEINWIFLKEPNPRGKEGGGD